MFKLTREVSYLSYASFPYSCMTCFARHEANLKVMLLRHAFNSHLLFVTNISHSKRITISRKPHFFLGNEMYLQ